MAAVRQLGVKMKKMQIPDVDPFKPYPMDRPKMGRAVIINNIHSESPESTVDVEALVETYEKVGFEVEVHNDCDAKKMGQIKREILKDETHEDSNCFVLTVICHGNNKGHLLDRNKIKGWVLEDFIGDLSLVESLAGRPKLLVIQSCRGVDWNDGRNFRVAALADDDDVEIPVVLPDKSDMFVAYATVPGYRAHRGDEGGSAYLQAFAAYLERWFMSQDLDAIYSMVNQYMASIEHGGSGMRQVSEKRSSLRFPLKFSEFHQTVSKTSVTKIQTKPALPPKLKRPQASPSQTTSPVLTLDLLSTNETGLQYYGRETLTVLSTGEVLVWGIASEESAPAFHVFRPESTGFKKIKEIKRLCNHDMIHALSTNVNEQEQLVVSCEDCRSITLYDLKTLETKTVFSNPEFYNDVICHGERGQIYVGHEVKGDIQAFQLVWSGGQLLGPKKVIHSGMGQYFSMYYIPSPYKLLVFSDNSPPGVLHAVSVETGEKIWKASWDIAGMMACPHGMVFSPKHQALLVADGPNRRIIVLNPNDGSQLQIRPVGDAISVLVHISLYKDKLILLYLDPENKDKVSYFAIR